MPAGHPIAGIIYKNTSKVFAAVCRMESFCHTYRNQVAVSLIGKDEILRTAPLYCCCHGKRPAVSSFADVKIPIIIGTTAQPTGTPIVFSRRLKAHYLGHVQNAHAAGTIRVAASFNETGLRIFLPMIFFYKFYDIGNRGNASAGFTEKLNVFTW